MEHETKRVVDLTEEEVKEIKVQIQEWKEVHGEIHITEFDDEMSFVWRALTKKEFNAAMDDYEDEYERAEYVCQVCVLDPVGIDYSDDMLAGIPEVLTENILLISGFSNDTKEMEMTMNKYEKDMDLFSNQISCVIVEVFPHLDIKDVEDWNLKKMLWYYSRAKWILGSLRGIELKRDDNSVGGTAAPDGTIVRGDPRDFPELL